MLLLTKENKKNLIFFSVSQILFFPINNEHQNFLSTKIYKRTSSFQFHFYHIMLQISRIKCNNEKHFTRLNFHRLKTTTFNFQLKAERSVKKIYPTSQSIRWMKTGAQQAQLTTCRCKTIEMIFLHSTTTHKKERHNIKRQWKWRGKENVFSFAQLNWAGALNRFQLNQSEE